MLSAACADASWTPSLPHYVLQLRNEERARHAPQKTERKPRQQPERSRSQRRWG